MARRDHDDLTHVYNSEGEFKNIFRRDDQERAPSMNPTYSDPS